MAIELPPLLNDSLVILGAKRTMLRKAKDTVETIVVGSSHGDYGFNPLYCPQSFNLCCRSQDLKHAFFLYQHTTHYCPNIKNIVLFYSLFSPGSFLEKSPSENDICPALNELFQLNIEYADEKLKILSHHIQGKLHELSVDIAGINGFLPNIGKGFFPESYGATKRASDHQRYNQRNDANPYLVHMLSLAKDRGHKVLIVIPPVRSDYKKAVGKNFNELFHPLLEIVSDAKRGHEVHVLNCYDDTRFIDSYFGDYDHLTPTGEGTALLSRLVHDAICSQYAIPTQ